MPIVPNLLERSIFLHFNQGPGPLLDIFGGVAFRIILAGINLRVFDTLAAGPLTPIELAQRTQTDPRGMTTLVETLATFGYVRQRQGRFANTPMTTKWLIRDAPGSVVAGFEYWGALLTHLWSNLEVSIRTGQPPVNLYKWVENQPEVSHDFQAWMVAIAHLVGDEVVRKIKVPATARRLLDVGGGHGLYSIALCRQHPALAATIFDSPAALTSATAQIAAAEMTDRVSGMVGDFLHDDLPAGYDIALLFNIVHGFTPEQNTALLRNVAAALNPGGMVVVAEQVAANAPGPTSRASAQILGLSYFHLLGGQVYTFANIKDWLTQAGFSQVRRKNLLTAPGNCLIMGRL